MTLIDDSPADTATPHSPLDLTAALGILGWNHLDPLLLAALALEAPVLLVGEHGTAKTLLVEQVATALGADFRHYNASLLNYDDLVGIPLPDGDGSGLRFVGTAGAIWGASFVFFDEVNRCRPDLQNKMFPLVHERRIAGTDLPELRHRWAAMNPPSHSDDWSSSGYVGSEALDTALADRFWFVVRVPGWRDLDRREREAVVAGARPRVDRVDALQHLVDTAVVAIDGVDADVTATVHRYVVVLADQLRESGIEISARRARILARSIIATIAAARVLGRCEGADDDLTALGALAELVVLNGLPHVCDQAAPSTAHVVAAHVHAWQLTVDERDTVKRALLAEPDLVQRLRLGIDLDADDATLGTLVIGAVTSLPTRVQRMGLATVLSRGLATRDLTPAAWSVIADHAADVLLPRTTRAKVRAGSALDPWRRAASHLTAIELSEDGVDMLQTALLNAAGADLLREIDLDVLLAGIRQQCELFGVTE